MPKRLDFIQSRIPPTSNTHNVEAFARKENLLDRFAVVARLPQILVQFLEGQKNLAPHRATSRYGLYAILSENAPKYVFNRLEMSFADDPFARRTT